MGHTRLNVGKVLRGLTSWLAPGTSVLHFDPATVKSPPAANAVRARSKLSLCAKFRRKIEDNLSFGAN